MAVCTLGTILFDVMFGPGYYLLQGSIPFAVIGSNNITDVRGKQVRVRQYPWGMAEGILLWCDFYFGKNKVFTAN